MSEYPKGSDGYQTDKAALRFEVGFTIPNILIFGMLFLKWFHTELVYHVKAAGVAWNVIGGILIAASTFFLWYGAKREWRPIQYGALWLGLLLLGILFACGWDFSNFHLPPNLR
jgi:hypothetical protein